MVVTLLLLAGLALLAIGGEALVRGASRLALLSGMPPLVVGLTVVAFGTSAPELAVSLRAALAGSSDLAVANVVGSNIFNVLGVLGVCALVAPLAVARGVIRRDAPLVVVASLILYAMATNGLVSRLEGTVLFAALVAYLSLALLQSRGSAVPVPVPEPLPPVRSASEAPPVGGMSVWSAIGATVAGIAALVLGARWMVDGAVAIATSLGISETIIGLTIVAAGTSLPEVAASVVATIRGARDIAVGNVVGSNLFNILAILGLTSIVAPGGLPVSHAMLALDVPVMIAVAVVMVPIGLSGGRVSRAEGLLLVCGYVAYTAYLVLRASAHPSLPIFVTAMSSVVLPLTAVAVVVPLLLDARRARASRRGEA